MKTIFIFLFYLLIINELSAQTPLLNGYVSEAIESNRSLKQQGFQIQKALYALQEAKGLFSPTVGYNFTYSTAQGGRSISFPVGDMLNPVYSTLNQLTRTSAFPQIENVNEQLVPKNFYDTRIKTQMPLFNAEIKYNYELKKQQVKLQEVEVGILKRELTKEVKIAYFNLLKATEALRIYDSGLKLLAESERVNRSLIDNGMANATVLIRTKNEQSKIEAERQAAVNTRNNAAAYLNFLLNRDLEAAIQVDTTYAKTQTPVLGNATPREELNKLQTAIGLNETVLRLNRAYKKPKIGTILDLGSQGSLTAISSKNMFALFGLSLDLPLYAGGRNQLKVKETEMEIASMNTQMAQVKEQLALQTAIAQNTFAASKDILRSKSTQVETAQRYHRDILRRYKEGQSNFIELLDAQTQITNAQLQQSIAHYDVWIRWAELERTL